MPDEKHASSTRSARQRKPHVALVKGEQPRSPYGRALVFTFTLGGEFFALPFFRCEKSLAAPRRLPFPTCPPTCAEYLIFVVGWCR